ncbi:MAG: hypothetical protein ACM3WV_02220 [Bacillota bacterium]
MSVYIFYCAAYLWFFIAVTMRFNEKKHGTLEDDIIAGLGITLAVWIVSALPGFRGLHPAEFAVVSGFFPVAGLILMYGTGRLKTGKVRIVSHSGGIAKNPALHNCEKGLHVWDGCKCRYCSRTLEHDLYNCICKRCGKEVHAFKGCVCSKCGYTAHRFIGCVCRNCGLENHDFEYTGRWCIIDESHREINADTYRCRKCGKEIQEEKAH